jgi:rubrerythrin
MTYRELDYKATRLLDNGKITLGEYEEMTKPLDREVEQEPKTGHWMGDSYDYICSNCEHSLNDLAQSMDYISFSKPKYCPNCGADMREVEE